MSNDTLKPLSIQRVKDVFAKQGWQFDEASEFAIRTGFPASAWRSRTSPQTST